MAREDLMAQIEVFHSQIPDEKQNEIASSLLTADGLIKVVIATSALSMGFDAVGTILKYLLSTLLKNRFPDL